jgi:hypothetical protein
MDLFLSLGKGWREISTLLDQLEKGYLFLRDDGHSRKT